LHQPANESPIAKAHFDRAAPAPHRPAWLLPSGLFAACTVFVLATFWLVTSLDIPFVVLTRDAAIAYTKDAPFYGGYLSNLGALFWCAAAAVALFTALVLRPITPGRREMRFFLFSGGLLSAILLIDDLFMLHDGALYACAGRGQNTTLLFQALFTIWFLWRFRRLILQQTRWSLLSIALLCFAASLFVDMVDLGIPQHVHHLYEEGPKLIGIVNWCVYFVYSSACAMNPRFQHGELATEAASPPHH